MQNDIKSVYIKNLILRDDVCIVFFNYTSQNTNHANIGVEMIEDGKHTISIFDRVIKEDEKSFTKDAINFDFEEKIVESFLVTHECSENLFPNRSDRNHGRPRSQRSELIGR